MMLTEGWEQRGGLESTYLFAFLRRQRRISVLSGRARNKAGMKRGSEPTVIQD